MISISKALEGLEGPVACVDSLDPFLARFGDRIGKAFVEGLAARMRWMSDRALLTVTPEAHEAALLAHIQSLFDGVIELRIEESGSGEVRRWIRYRDLGIS
jgi:archaellum biogenesis ATPase FlaH